MKEQIYNFTSRLMHFLTYLKMNRGYQTLHYIICTTFYTYSKSSHLEVYHQVWYKVLHVCGGYPPPETIILIA